MPQWYALYTKPRAEKKTADRLLQQGFETYCPTYTTLRQWSDRKKKVTLPALPSYIFVHIEEQQRYEVLQDMGVMNFVYWLGKPAIIKEEEMQRLKSFLSDHSNQSCQVRQLQAGERVKINQGGMMGLEGIVEKSSNNKAYLFVENLGLVISCDISAVDTVD